MGVMGIPTIVIVEPPGSLQQEGSSSLESASSDTAMTVILVAGLILMLAAGTFGAVVHYRKKRFKMQPRFIDVGLSVSPMYASRFPVEKVDQFAPLWSLLHDGRDDVTFPVLTIWTTAITVYGVILH